MYAGHAFLLDMNTMIFKGFSSHSILPLHAKLPRQRLYPKMCCLCYSSFIIVYIATQSHLSIAVLVSCQHCSRKRRGRCRIYCSLWRETSNEGQPIDCQLVHTLQKNTVYPCVKCPFKINSDRILYTQLKREFALSDKFTN